MASDDFLENTQEVTIAADRDTLMKRGAVKATGRAMVIVMMGRQVGHRVHLDDSECLIGRGTDAGLQLDGDSISRVHAKIRHHDGDHFLIDCESTNGSFVNYVRVTEKRLHDGDAIQIGSVLLKYLSGDNIETAYHEEARRLVRRDALTGGLNRPTFDEELRVATRKAEGGADLSLVLFDLDHFKKVNDTHGHTAGDLVLKEVGACALQSTVSPHLFARIGGEEFAIVARATMEETVLLAESLRSRIADLKVIYEGVQIPVSASFGVVSFGAGMKPADLYEMADKKLYVAKEGGRNRVES